MLKLYIGNKNYSSWSMRPWVLLKQAGIAFEEAMVRFDSFAAGSDFKNTLESINPVGKVPVLVCDGLAVWDTLAICEYLAEYAGEKFPGKALWPRDAKARACPVSKPGSTARCLKKTSWILRSRTGCRPRRDAGARPRVLRRCY